MRFQLRDYRIAPGKMADFVEEWRSGVLPLRCQAGFTVVGAWWSDESNRFVWVIGHEDFAAADRAYYESPERAALSPDPARHIEEARTEFVTEAHRPDGNHQLPA